MECLALKDLTSPTKSSSVDPDEESEQKENVKAERRRSPESAVPLLLMNRKGPTSDQTHITPIKQTVLAEPWTPTANLKVLISAASPDIRDREMKKGLFRTIENDKDKPASPDVLVEEMEVEDVLVEDMKVVCEEDDAEKKPSRKQKSLGLLCQKFLALYPDYPPAHSPISISLDEVATSLGVERRRIYDIVNVLESLTIVGRIAKNSYTWYGRQRLLTTLKELQRRGREQRYHLQMDLTSVARTAGQGREEDGGEGDTGSAGSNRKDKSLRLMSQKFVMLFLVSKTQTVTLDAAAKVLIEESLDCSSHSKYKTKVRRLYDIANVLTSLGLIKKVHVREERGKKPAFKWLGPVEFSRSGNTVNVAAASQRKPEASVNSHDVRGVNSTNHASFNITPTSAAALQSLDSAPCSSRCYRTGLINQAETMSSGVGCEHACESSTDRLNTSSNIQLIQSSTHSQAPPTVLPEHLLISPPHCLAYLPSLTRPSLVMLYRPPNKQDCKGQRSAESESGEKRKQRTEESEEEVKKKKSVSEESEKTGAEPQRDAAEWSQIRDTGASPGVSDQKVSESRGGDGSDHAQPSHYLYVPNNAGLNSLNFLIPAGQPGGGMALPPSSVPTVALPYVLVPSATLSPPTLLTSSGQQQGSDTAANLGYNLPAVMTPAHFMVGVSPYSMTAVPEIMGSLPSSPVIPAGSPQQTVSIKPQIPLTPHTPKETAASFFQTPGSLEGSISSAAATRKRGSAQRRLDISRPAGVDRKGNTQV